MSDATIKILLTLLRDFFHKSVKICDIKSVADKKTNAPYLLGNYSNDFFSALDIPFLWHTRVKNNSDNRSGSEEVAVNRQ